MTQQTPQTPPAPSQPAWAQDLTDYLKEVETFGKETPRSQRFTLLLQTLPFVPKEFVSDYNRSMEKGLSNVQDNVVVRGEADALFGSVIVEFEKKLPAKADGSNAKLIEAKGQLCQYAAMLWSGENPYARTRYIGIATDGVRFFAYTPEAKNPFAPSISAADVSLSLLEFADWSKYSPNEVKDWFDRFFFRQEILAPTSWRIVRDFGPRSHAFRTTGLELLALWKKLCTRSEFAVVYDQWEKYLLIVYGNKVAADELFVRHTYLATLAKVMAWRRLAGESQLPDPEQVRELIEGGLFVKQGLLNFIEEDFFSWLARGDALAEGVRVVRALFSLMQKYDLGKLSEDVLKALYQELVDPETRHDLGEYYTPDWLAHEVVTTLLDQKADARLLDPSCGSGTFLYLAVRELRQRRGDAPGTLAHILQAVCGADIHPLAVTVAKTNYLLALGDLLHAREGGITLPVYMADTLRLPEELMQSGEYGVTLEGREVYMDKALLQNAAVYDEAVGLCQEFAEAHRGTPITPAQVSAFLAGRGFALADNAAVQKSLFQLTGVLKAFIEANRDSIWAFVLKNLYKPLLLRKQFDALMGNPPWIAFRNTDPDYQAFLKRHIKTEYALESRGHLITHMEVATLFLVRAADLYLKRGGTVAFVLPRSLMHADQHDGLRRRAFKSLADTSQRLVWSGLWDCEKVSPLFTVPSCVLFGQKLTIGTPQPNVLPGKSFAGQLTQRNAGRDAARAQLVTADAEFTLHKHGPRSFWATGQGGSAGFSPYKDKFDQGATLFPRSTWFVQVPPSPLGINVKMPFVETDTHATDEAKDAYKDLYLSGNVEARFLFASFLSADVLPFAPVDYRPCVLPLQVDGGHFALVGPDEADEMGCPGLARWVRVADKEWAVRRGLKADKMTQFDRINYRNGLTAQNPHAAYRVIYPDVQRVAVATIVASSAVTFPIGKQNIPAAGIIMESAVYSCEVSTLAEAQYLCAVLNSGVMDTRLSALRSREQKAHPHVHKKIFDVAPIPQFAPANPDHAALVALCALCAQKVTQWKADGMDGATDIGVQRRKARAVIAAELLQIDQHVRRVLGD